MKCPKCGNQKYNTAFMGKQERVCANCNTRYMQCAGCDESFMPIQTTNIWQQRVNGAMLMFHSKKCANDYIENLNQQAQAMDN